MHFNIVGPPPKHDPIAEVAKALGPSDRRRVAGKADTLAYVIDTALEAADARRQYGTWDPDRVRDPRVRGALTFVQHWLEGKKR